MSVAPILEIRGVTKPYGSLRPLRIQAFSLRAGERVAMTGLDAPAAEVLVNLVTGATLPDEGEVRLFGRPTSAITDADDWMATLDRIGMVTGRALLVGELSVAQALAMPFTLSIDSIPDEIAKSVERLCGEVGLGADEASLRLGGASALVRARVHLARALASHPQFLVLEHPSSLFEGDAPGASAVFARDVNRVGAARGLAVLVLSARPEFARMVARAIYEFGGAAGRLRNRSGWRRFLG